MDNRTLSQLAQEAMNVQNACNLVAVANGMGRCVSRLRDILKQGDAAADCHPITILWADKIASLAGTQSIGDRRVMDAYNLVALILKSDAVDNLARLI